MRAFRRLAALLVLALAASARAAAPVRLILPGAAVAPACGACASVLSGAPALSAAPAPLAPVLVSASGAPLSAAPLAAAVPAALPLPAPAAHPLFAGAAPASDGALVYPHLTDAHAVARDLPRQVEAVRATALRALADLRASVALGGWNGEGTKLDGPCCGDAAPKLAVMLRGRGLPARLVEAEFHYYVILDLPEGQIVVDPTVRQFFGRADAPPSVPTVFVGTIEQLHGLFERHKLAKTTKYDPSRIYFREAREREAKLNALDAEVRSGRAAEHEPLRRFLSAAR
ncbi:MAG: hypothetical protein HY079_00010 [Elusimicrobia bacterium]|nr:hypothetical protein [Elusimicrobiota bacterium]